MRAAITLLVAVAAITASEGQLKVSEGVYRTADRAQPWSVDAQGVLIWNGQPYSPVGAAIKGSPDGIAAAVAGGFKDVLVDLPRSRSAWDAAIPELNRLNLRYVIRLDSVAPGAPGVVVEPQAYRVSGIKETRTLRIELPGSRSALVVLASQRGGDVADFRRVPVVNGSMEYLADPKGGVEYVALIYPLSEATSAPDYWEGFDAQRDELLGILSATKPGPGLRGMVNPAGRALSLPGNDLHAVPTSPGFRVELARFLEEKYRSMETAARTWSVSGSEFLSTDEKRRPLKGFADLARLVPLWNGARGVGRLWDPEGDRLYECDSKRSAIWRDIAEVVNRAGLRRTERFVSAVKREIDVPILQEWNGWAATYESPQSPFDGIGVAITATSPSEMIQQASRAASSILRWRQPGWLVATDIQTTAENASQAGGALDDFASMGVRAAFVSGVPKASSLPAMLPADERPIPVFYPENATNPAQPQRLPAGRWWLPTPSDGNRIDLGSDYFGYRMRMDGVTSFTLWTRKPGRTKLRLVDTKTAVFTSVDGRNLNIKPFKKGVELDLSDVPLTITNTEEIPIPEPALDETLDQFAKLMKLATAEKRDAVEERIQFTQALPGVDRNPGGAYGALRTAYYRAAQRLGTFTWIEAEITGVNNFSEVVKDAGCSNGAALSLKTPLVVESGYFAEYGIAVRSRLEQQVWISARLTKEQRASLVLNVAGQELTITGEPVGLYGDGFGWYSMGVTRLAGDTSRVRLRVDATGPSDLAIDAILLTPSSFAPRGPAPPDPSGVRG